MRKREENKERGRKWKRREEEKGRDKLLKNTLQLWILIPTQRDPYPDIAGCQKSSPSRILVLSWLDMFSDFLTNNTII